MDSSSPNLMKERVRRVENGLLPAAALSAEVVEPATLAERMEYYQVPGVSITVIAGSEIDWASGYGVLVTGGSERVGTETLFQAASISKPVTAMAALRLVEAGRLDLDEDVNRYLTSWKVPANGWWQPRVTIRQLMSHSGGTTVHGFPGYRHDQPLPSLVQVLNGEPPANTRAIRVNAVPGTQFRYSVGGTSILQQLLIDVTGTPFPDLMRELVLAPLGMTDSSFEQPLPEARRAVAASGHRTGGEMVDGGWHVYPEMAAAGLWTTPTDLARLAIEIQHTRAGDQPKILSQATLAQMFAPQVEEFVTLGFFLDGKDDSLRFSHSGGNEGFQCYLVAYRDGGFGAVVMTNGDAGGDLYGEVLRGVAREYAWPDYLPEAPDVVEVDPAIAAAYVGVYELRPGVQLTVTSDAGALSLQVPGQTAISLLPTSETEYVARVVNTRIVFARNAQGAVSGLTFRQSQADRFAPRLG